jgi:nitrite reductase/ring-hydroxylating ferredoxin subunit
MLSAAKNLCTLLAPPMTAAPHESVSPDIACQLHDHAFNSKTGEGARRSILRKLRYILPNARPTPHSTTAADIATP